MLNIHTLVLGLYQVNCYVVHKADSDRCVVIDPGYEPEKISAFLTEKGNCTHSDSGADIKKSGHHC